MTAAAFPWPLERKWEPLCTHDSQALEAAYQQLQEAIPWAADLEKLEAMQSAKDTAASGAADDATSAAGDEATTAAADDVTPAAADDAKPADADDTKPADADDAKPAADEDVEVPRVPIRGGLFDVDIVERDAYPVYWDGEPLKIMRATWFFGGKVRICSPSGQTRAA